MGLGDKRMGDSRPCVRHNSFGRTLGVFGFFGELCLSLCQTQFATIQRTYD